MTDVQFNRWWQRRCPAIGYRSRTDFPRCDQRVDHDGPHVAERGMYNETWTEQWI